MRITFNRGVLRQDCMILVRTIPAVVRRVGAR